MYHINDEKKSEHKQSKLYKKIKIVAFTLNYSWTSANFKK
jgi:hypothetical protein